MIAPDYNHFSKEEIYRLVADFSLDWEEWRDPNGALIYVSPSCERLTGFSPAEFLTQPDLLERIIHPDDLPAFISHQESILQHGAQNCELDFRILGRDGSLRWISHICQAVLDAQGAWLGQRSSNRDVTQQKLNEHALQALINVPSELLLLLDLDGRIVVANRLLASFTRLPLEELPGRVLWELLPAHSAQFRKGVFDQVIQSGQQVRVEDQTSIPGTPNQLFDTTVYPILDTQGKIYRIAIISHDITEIKQTEAALRQANALLLTVIRQSPVGMVALDANGVVTLLEGVGKGRSGSVNVREAQGKHYSQVFENFSEVKELFSKALAGIETGNRLFTLPDGSTYDAYFAPIRDENGAIAGATGIATNVTAYHQTQAELRRARQQLEVILEGVGEEVLVVNARRELVYVNQTAAQLSGYASPEALLADRDYFTSFTVYDENDLLVSPLAYPAVRALRGEKVSPTVLRYEIKDGSASRWFLVSGSPVFDHNNQVELAVFLVQDIQEMKVAQDAVLKDRDELEMRVQERTAELAQINQELRRERDFSRSLIEIAQIGLLVLDMHGAIIQMNPYLERLFGYTLEEARGKNWLDMITLPKHRRNMKYALIRALRGFRTGPAILPLLTRTGRLVQIECYDQALRDAQGKPVGLLVIGQDVTMRLEIERQLHRNTDKAEALARIGSRINAQLELKAVLQTICEETARMLDYHAAMIMLYEPALDSLSIEASYGFPDEFVHGISSFPRALLEKNVSALGTSMIIDDLQTRELQFAKELLKRTGIRTVLAMVLFQEQELIGLLCVASLPEPKPPSDEDLELLRALAGQAELAISRAQMFEEISESRKRLQALARNLIEVRFEEKRHIARELHDEMGQLLTSLQMKLDMVQRSIPDYGAMHESMRPAILEIRTVITQVLQQVRDLSLDLRPPLLDDMGLVPALVTLFQRLRRDCGLEVSFSHNLTNRRYSPGIENSVFRIIQEELTNITRYAGVNEAAVRMWADDLCLGLQVVDEGAGFDLQTALSSGLSGGLSGIKERVSLYDGTLEIETQPGAGCRITAEFPLEQDLGTISVTGEIIDGSSNLVG